MIRILAQLLQPTLARAQEIQATLNVEGVQEITIWEVFGIPSTWGQQLEHLFSYRVFLHGLVTANFYVTVVFFILVIALIIVISKMLSYVKKQKTLFDNLSVMGGLFDPDSAKFFQDYCRRLPNGTYECSFATHKKLSHLGKLSLHGAISTVFVKFVIIFMIFGAQSGFIEAFSGRTGTNYTIFIDSTVGGGGNISSSTYALAGSFGSSTTSDSVSSATYEETSGIVSVEDEPSIGISWSGAIDFGSLSNASTAYGSHTLTAYFNGNAGYDLIISGSPPTTGTNTIDPIGATATVPSVGVEQFGINLTGNTIPSIVGADPIGGHGAVDAQYNQANKFAWASGDVIATSTQRSDTTTYTVTAIININEVTSAGTYLTNLKYSIIPKF
jgi:hypothetical protein